MNKNVTKIKTLQNAFSIQNKKRKKRFTIYNSSASVSVQSHVLMQCNALKLRSA